MPRAAWCDPLRLSTAAQSPTATEDGDAGQCKVQLESPSWRNFLAHFEWEESEWLVPRAETLGGLSHRSLHHGVGLCRIRGARKRFDHDWEIGRQGSDQQKPHSRSCQKKSATFEF